MKLQSVLSWLLVMVLFIAPAVVFSKPREENLIKAWEQVQQNDSKTIVFKKKGANEYQFKTQWFPFDGELRILNVTIDDRNKPIHSAYGYILGVVEVELVDLPKDFMQKYSYSYSLWARGNMLYYTEADDKWVTANTLFSENGLADKSCFEGKYISIIYDNMFIIAIIFLLIICIFVMRAVKKQQQRYQKYLNNSEETINKSFELTRQSLEINRENLEIQKQILEVLKNKRSV